MTLNIEELKVVFPKDLEELLVFEDVGDSIRVSPRQYLGSENFAKIASIIRDKGGEYISAGKESHFRIMKEPSAQPKTEGEVLPRAYRKDVTVVLKVSKQTVVTTTFWKEGKAYLHTISRVLKGADKKPMTDDDGNWIWEKRTVRLSPTVLQQWINELVMLRDQMDVQQSGST